MRHRLRYSAIPLVLLLLLTSCADPVGAITGTPTADKVLLNARRVARDLDSYRASFTVNETTHYPQSPHLDFTESTVGSVGMENRQQFHLVPEPGLEVILSDDNVYSRLDEGGWTVAPVGFDEDDLFPHEFSSLPPGHPEPLLNRRNFGATSLSDIVTLDGKLVYIVSGLVPAPLLGTGTAPHVLSDTARIYIDSTTFHVVRVEIDHNVRDSLREDSGYQVIPGVVEIQTTEVYEYRDHNSPVEISVPEVPAER